ncbi:L-seryl-tRNA(Sec) kinase-like [Portunus trituberculatus]|uniref:L-seryl-tRNA(Sec) kinase-like n=1 Tax=Portunus trituberculatus TaxID=210409 RepID=UPI001E1D08A4|nr:L-seryl-tRNA(Sec) kinase-like [Portunus trituberculatus]
METNVVLVLLVGLPGSGKTTLCRALKTHHEELHDRGRLVVIHLCYDDLIPLSVQREFAEQKRTEGQQCGEELKGKEGKESCKVEGSKDRGVNKDMTDGIGDDWKSARRKIHTQVDQFVQYLTTGKANSGVVNFPSVSLEELGSGSKFVILLDDNFYYRSMRYEYFQLARRHSAAFCQLYLHCSMEEAVLHNDMREERVPTGVLTAMAERMQAPQAHMHVWEANTCVLNTGVGQLSEAWNAVIQSFQMGLLPLQDREKEVAEARQRCSESVVHQADLCLRAIVKYLVKEKLQHVDKRSEPASQVAARINAARQAVLAGLRAGAEVPHHLAESVTQVNKHEFETFLEAEIKKIISE